jgi:hypothetical protein
MAPMRKLENDNDDFSASTIAIWSPRLGRRLSREESRQILVNVTGFARIVAEWARNETAAIPGADNDNVIRR